MQRQWLVDWFFNMVLKIANMFRSGMSQKQISREERDMFWGRSEMYWHWLLDRVFNTNSGGCITIMIFPIEVGKPNYRDAELP